MWDKAIPAFTGLLGVALSALFFLFAGWQERERQAEIWSARTLAEFAEAATLSEGEQNEAEFAKKKGVLVVHADPEVVRAYGRYQFCEGAWNCQHGWAEVVNAIRVSTGADPVAPETVIDAFFGTTRATNPAAPDDATSAPKPESP